MRVQVYKNLHKGCWSVRSKKTGLVIGHYDQLYLTDCTMVVRPGGRDRVLREKKKNVHAFIEGEFLHPKDLKDRVVDLRPLYYNPYKFDSFVDGISEGKVDKAELVYLGNKPYYMSKRKTY